MKKYAVYRSPTGFYCYDYYDNLEDLAGGPFAGMISEAQLPVVIDGKGGYFHFTEDDYGFEKIIETDAKEPLSVEERFFRNHPDFKLGWISPEGDTYSCSFTGHTEAAEALAAKFYKAERFPERTLEKAGWLKVIDSWNGTEMTHGQYVYSLTRKITRRQADKLYDLGLYDAPEIADIIENDDIY